jgi:hypothetical protein
MSWTRKFGADRINRSAHLNQGKRDGRQHALHDVDLATANRGHLVRLSPEDLETELAKSPDPKRSEIKRQVVSTGSTHR